MEGSLISSHGERSTPGASSSTSMSSFAAPLPKVMPVQKGAPRPKGVPKVKSLPKRGHQSSEIPTPRVQQPKASSSSHMPTVGEDIFGSWDEIEREERLNQAELNAAQPGDAILGPIDQLPDDEFPELPFKVFTTRYGEVYHLSRRCRHLTSTNSGISTESRWCSRCRRSAYQSGSVPRAGDVLYLKGTGRDAHSIMRCPAALGANHYQVCTACLDQPTESSLG